MSGDGRGVNVSDFLAASQHTTLHFGSLRDLLDCIRPNISLICFALSAVLRQRLGWNSDPIRRVLIEKYIGTSLGLEHSLHRSVVFS